MNRKTTHAFLLSILSLVSVLACTDEGNLCATGSLLHLERAELRDALVDELQRSGIKYGIHADGRVCYSPSQHDYITSKVIELNSEIYGGVDQINLLAGEYSDAVIERLRRESIRFEISDTTIPNQVRITVLDPNDLDRVRELTGDVARQIFESR